MFVRVLLPLPLPPFTYETDLPLQKGQWVHVPFGKRTLWGIILETHSAAYPEAKNVKAVHPFFALSFSLLTFMQQCAAYTLTPLGMLLRMVWPEEKILTSDYSPSWKLSSPPVKGVGITLFREVCDTTNQCFFWGTQRQWTEKIGPRTTTTWIKNLSLTPCPDVPDLSLTTKKEIVLTPSQQEALACLTRTNTSQTTLLEGVTGSGKTEVCLAYIQSIYRPGAQILILVPEIALSQQWIDRLQKYFHGSFALWHSHLTQAQRVLTLSDITTGRLSIIVGARSALFLPYPHLQCIIVDEEHDVSYKQEEPPFYHGRDMAVYRAHQEKIPCILLSATPGLETIWNVRQNRYQHIQLAQRYQGSTLPDVSLIDLQDHPLSKGHFISLPLRHALAETFQQKQQSLLFMNKKGYGSLLMCYHCGYKAACPHCSVWLTVYKSPTQRLLCHYCGFTLPFSSGCPSCHQECAIKVMGAGIEKIQEECRSFLPEARTCLLSSDHLQTPEAFQKILHDILDQKIDILIGTQILAKGHHFPALTCVGVIDGDFALSHLDIRSAERLYQLLCQVLGRAGREALPGTAYIQTSQPSHPLFQMLASHDLQGFIDQELALRQEWDFPPFTRVTCYQISGLSELMVQQTALRLKAHIPPHAQVQILGPTPAPLSPLRRRYRWRLLFKTPRAFDVQSWIRSWVGSFETPSSIQTLINVDPYQFL